MNIVEALKISDKVRRVSWADKEYILVDGLGCRDETTEVYELTKHDILADDWEPIEKQIGIDELIPLLKRGWVAFDEYSNEWSYHEEKPEYKENIGIWESRSFHNILDMFNIAPFDGDWKDSLIEIK